jgi:hypothetical protein
MPCTELNSKGECSHDDALSCGNPGNGFLKLIKDQGCKPMKLLRVRFEFGSSHFLKSRLSTQLSRIGIPGSLIFLAADERLDFRRLEALAFIIQIDERTSI